MGKYGIMIVEDEKLLALSMEKLLNRLGYQVCGAAASGLEAVELAISSRPDLILMDIHLHGEMDGIEAAEQIRHSLDIPTVFTTAYADDETLRRAKQVEPSAYILKPFEIKELQATIEICRAKHEAERRLRGRERWVSTVLGSIGDGVIAVDMAGAITYLNPAAEKIMGWMCKEAAGLQLSEILSIKVSPASLPKDICDVAGGNVVEIVNRGGTRVWVEFTESAIGEGKNEEMGRVLVLRDVTDKKRIEKEMAVIREEMAQAQKMEALGKFAGGIAHDFNNYLCMIQGHAGLHIRGAEGTGASTEHVEKVMEITEKASGLIRNLLVFSRRKSFQRERVPINESIQNMMVLTKCMISTRIPITLHLAQDDPIIFADPVQFDQVVLNLVMNAKEAMPSGGELTIRTETTSLPDPFGKDGKPYVHLGISDTGLGMNPQMIGQTYSPTFSSRTNGSGFGLFVVSSIVKSHGGFFRIDSRPGKGTDFHIWFPACTLDKRYAVQADMESSMDTTKRFKPELESMRLGY